MQLSHDDVATASKVLAIAISKSWVLPRTARLFAIPRGGVTAAYSLLAYLRAMIGVQLVSDPAEADFILDDLYDSGATMARYASSSAIKCVLFAKGTPPAGMLFGVSLPPMHAAAWLTFPWEATEELSADDIPRRLLQFIGEDPNRGGLLETPARFLKAWREYSSGYGKNAASLLKVFEDGAEKVDEMVLVKGIPVYSHCVVGETLVDTPHGRVPIKELKDGDWVYCIDAQTLNLHLVQCQNPRITRRDAELVRVHADGEAVECTPDHLFLTHNRGWIEAGSLLAGDSLVSLYRGADHAGRPMLTGFSAPGKTTNVVHFRDAPLIGVLESRFVANYFGMTAEYLACADASRKFPQGVVHHCDESPWNNDPENLRVLSVGEHNQAHKRTLKLAGSTTRKARAGESSGRPEVREKRSRAVAGSWPVKGTPEYAVRVANMKGSRNHRVVRIEKVLYTADVYCMTVPQFSSFFANGICVHNCEHHLAPFFGVAHVGYIPHGRIVGLSKISRLVDMFAKRLQVQERLTNQIADAMNEHLHPLGVGVVIECRHMCMESRGIQRQGTTTVTSAMRGALHDEASARAEFLSLIKNH